MSRMVKASTAVVAQRQRRRGDLDLGAARRTRRAAWSTNRPHAAALAQSGDQHAELDAGAAEPAVERLAAHLLLGAELGQRDEGAVGQQHLAAGIGEHQAVGRTAQIGLQHRVGAGLGRCGASRRCAAARRAPLGAHRRQAHQHEGGVVLAEQRGRHRDLVAVVGQLRAQRVLAADGARRGEQGLQPLGMRRLEQRRQRRARPAGRGGRRTACAPPGWPRAPSAWRRRRSAPPRRWSRTGGGSASRPRGSASSRAPSPAATRSGAAAAPRCRAGRGRRRRCGPCRCAVVLRHAHRRIQQRQVVAVLDRVVDLAPAPGARRPRPAHRAAAPRPSAGFRR